MSKWSRLVACIVEDMMKYLGCNATYSHDQKMSRDGPKNNLTMRRINM